MFEDLPHFVQKQVLYYLSTDNFTAAKALHDTWMRNKAARRFKQAHNEGGGDFRPLEYDGKAFVPTDLVADFPWKLDPSYASKQTTETVDTTGEERQ